MYRNGGYVLGFWEDLLTHCKTHGKGYGEGRANTRLRISQIKIDI